MHANSESLVGCHVKSNGGLQTANHVLSACCYLPFAADTIGKAFGPVRDGRVGQWFRCNISLYLIHRFHLIPRNDWMGCGLL